MSVSLENVVSSSFAPPLPRQSGGRIGNGTSTFSSSSQSLSASLDSSVEMHVVDRRGDDTTSKLGHLFRWLLLGMPSLLLSSTFFFSLSPCWAGRSPSVISIFPPPPKALSSSSPNKEEEKKSKEEENKELGSLYLALVAVELPTTDDEASLEQLRKAEQIKD